MTVMKKISAFLFVFAALHFSAAAQESDSMLPIRGFAIEAPARTGVEEFIRFIDDDLAPAGINLLILRVDWNYDYRKHPELRDENPLTKADAEKLAAACRRHGIRLVPQVNLLGHQSWAKETHALLREYPQFDENPSVKTEYYTGWPNPYGLYCKSYCPLHPDVHKVVFDVVDEICDAFQADAFHAGMDEVFYIGEDECPRCHGKDRSELFAGEVTAIHDHLASKGRQMMIWGDRLLDGRTTGLGEWEASYNDTWRAIDMIPKDILICDWHYERADLSAVYFAMKGLPVVSCGHRDADISVQQIKDMIKFRGQAPEETAGNLQGYIHTIWSSAGQFLRSYYGEESAYPLRNGSVEAAKAVLQCFREL
ncbi:MAG: family 20 glycosylhydrolase [Bacteroidales bacterium]|nr:family 20 glycosylhydrolase [Bacteroidales bacterium]